MVVEELYACSKLEGEVEARGVVDRDVARSDEKASVADDKRLDAAVRDEVDALAQWAEASGIGRAGTAGACDRVAGEAGARIGLNDNDRRSAGGDGWRALRECAC